MRRREERVCHISSSLRLRSLHSGKNCWDFTHKPLWADVC